PSADESELVGQLERARALHQARAAAPELAAALDWLAAWQSRRLRATYADLAREPRYADAIAFFQADLYGPGDFSRRDADLARVAPLMARVMPAGVMAMVARAMELSNLSHELDRGLLSQLPERAPLSAATYGSLSGARQPRRKGAPDRAHRRRGPSARPLRRQAVRAFDARRDAATGAPRRPGRVAALPRARRRRLPAHGRGGRVPGDHRDSRNGVDERHFQRRARTVSGAL